jgi:ribonuclease HI
MEMGVTVGMDSGDLAYALRLLASGQAVGEVWKEAGFGSRKALAERIYDLAERVTVESPRGKGKGLKLVAYSDGASNGNPGEAGCGAVLVDERGEVLLEDYRYLGRATNNVAEYQGAILALKRASELGASQLELRVDSGLLANQIMGRYKVKSRMLAHLYQDLKKMAELFEKFTVTQIKGCDNKQADRLANLAISSRKRR